MAAANYILNQSYCEEETKRVPYAESGGTTSYSTQFLRINTDYEDISNDDPYVEMQSIGVGKGDSDDIVAKYVGRYKTNDDYQVIPLGDDLKFYNDYLILKDNFKAGITYYFHGKIKRTENQSQTFYVKLKKMPDENNTTGELEVVQYIKTIIVAGGDARDWVDVEFIFTPLETFPALVFELQRISNDYIKEIRYPVIAYLEISEVINYKLNGEFTASLKTPLRKIGVQSHPGLLMCINGEEIRIGRTGIYELRDGIVKTTFFAAVHSAEELPETGEEQSRFEKWKTEVNDKIKDINDRQEAKPNGSDGPIYYEKEGVNYYPSKDSTILDGKDYFSPNVKNPVSDDPAAEGLYEARIRITDNKTYYTPTEDTVRLLGKDYYELENAKLLTDKAAEAEKQKIHSVVFCKTPKERTTSSFILDYMYSEKKGGN